MKTLIAAIGALALLAGCSDMKVQEYSGSQNWPTSTGSFSTTVGGMRIYFGPPDRPYRVYDRLVVSNDDRDDAVKEAVRTIKRRAMKAGTWSRVERNTALIVENKGEYQGQLSALFIVFGPTTPTTPTPTPNNWGKY
jgi:hypothetical protein